MYTNDKCCVIYLAWTLSVTKDKNKVMELAVDDLRFTYIKVKEKKMTLSSCFTIYNKPFSSSLQVNIGSIQTRAALETHSKSTATSQPEARPVSMQTRSQKE